ncbi:hypothetical protein AKJ16_DCAP11005 [Drosera capensis]
MVRTSSASICYKCRRGIVPFEDIPWLGLELQSISHLHGKNIVFRMVRYSDEVKDMLRGLLIDDGKWRPSS